MSTSDVWAALAANLTTNSSAPAPAPTPDVTEDVVEQYSFNTGMGIYRYALHAYKYAAC